MKGLSVLILAAGAARRMNQAKMLLPFGNATILQTIIDHTKDIKPDSICIVTGFYHQEIIANIQDDQIQFVYNELWEEGMSSSIKKGISHLISQNPEIMAVLILVADQPYISSNLLNEMTQLQEQTGKGIVAASYAGISGTPVLFSRDHFSNLEKLSGDKGARSILHQYQNDLITVDFPLGEIDIDTEDDYHKLLLK
ncbi:MAG: nucleotidyltransferase family protein [Bacteroidota bacterium]